ncbi:MAG: hypothetical protein H6819_03625 [Phycisphaerales bacterium]|nr:hypothetical protein [Phycisphaerales bacterium]MCB9856287.1 hypothetical protein [Phycisphaerales bacterium]MCB9863274.1 hypothetical protein [Phycisphaerales bacterium]
MSLQASMRNKWFISGAVLLVVAALGMQSAAEATALAILKRSVRVRKPLRDFDPSCIADIKRLAPKEPLTEEAAGTREYLTLQFQCLAREFRDLGVCALQVHYYSSDGRPPIIPHTPEVCYRQVGNLVSSITPMTYEIKMADGTTRDIPFKCLRMTYDPNGEAIECCVLYTLCVSGDFVGDREVARFKMAMPWNRAVYFAKFETVIPISKNGRFEDALEAAKRVMVSAIPVIVADHLPTDDDLRKAADARPASDGAKAE